MIKLSEVRNIGIIAHIDAGKTTLTERILFYTGVEHKMGEVHEGTATMDYLEEEQARGITITSAATTCYWSDHRINIIDTPGHVDFTAEVERSLRVLDGAIGILDGVAGVEAQSETVWKQADRYKVPRLVFVNKLDRVGSDFYSCVEELKKRLGVVPLPLQMPIGVEKDFEGLVDLVSMQAEYYDPDSLGRQVIFQEIPESIREAAANKRKELIEILADHDEAILEKYLDNQELTVEDLKRAIRRATLAFKVVPVLGGAAFKNKGVQNVLDSVIDYLPSPLDRGQILGVDPRTGRPVKRMPDPSDPFCALAFKTTYDQHGEIIYLRIYSGTLRLGKGLYNPRKDKVERVTRIFIMHADERNQVDEAKAGEIVAAMGLKFSGTGDTLCPKSHQITLEGMVFPEPVISMSIEPQSIKEKDELVAALTLLAKDDPTFTWMLNEETGQMIISGMGELHLEILKNRMVKNFKLSPRIGKPRVAYRQTIREPALGKGTFEKMVGEKELFAEVTLSVAPMETGRGVAYENRLGPEMVPKLYWPAVENAVNSAAVSGLELGYSIINIKVAAVEGQFDPLRSNDIAFGVATEMALGDAMKKGGIMILEPIMAFEIRSPREYLHNITSDLNARRAKIQELVTDADPVVVKGTVPMARVFGYSSAIRSISQGRASFAMQPDRYQPSSMDILKEID